MIYLGIGLPKTGTCSLTAAMNILGIDTVHDALCPSKQIDGGISVIGWLSYRYQEIDKKYPGCKFIFTNRDIDTWHASCVKWFNRVNNAAMRMNILGADIYDKRQFNDVYYDTYAEVKKYFFEREDDIIHLDICAGEGWEKLCKFTNTKIPDVPFPADNRQVYK